MNKKNLTILIVTILFAAAAASADISKVARLHLTPQSGETVLKIDVSGPFQFTHETAEAKDGKPFRIVVDLFPATHDLGGKEFTDLPATMISSIRTSQYSTKPENIVRVVCDLNQTVMYRIEKQGNAVYLYLPDQKSGSFAAWSSPVKTAVVLAKTEPKPATEVTVKQSPSVNVSVPAAKATVESKSAVSIVKQTPTEKESVSETKQVIEPQPTTSVAKQSPPVTESASATKSATESKPAIGVATQFKSNRSGEIDHEKFLLTQQNKAKTAARTTVASTPTTESPKKNSVENPNVEPPKTEASLSVPAPQKPGAEKMTVVATEQVSANNQKIEQVQSKPAETIENKEAKIADVTASPVKTVSEADKPGTADKNPVPGDLADIDNNKKEVEEAEVSPDELPAINVSEDDMIEMSEDEEESALYAGDDAESEDNNAVSDELVEGEESEGDSDGQKPTSRFRRKPAFPAKMKGTIVAEFPKRIVMEYEPGTDRDPFENLLVTDKYSESPIQKKIPDVETSKLVGILESVDGQKRALLEDHDGYGYIVKSGDKVKKGYVGEIFSDKAYFRLFEYGWSRTVALFMSLN